MGTREDVIGAWLLADADQEGPLLVAHGLQSVQSISVLLLVPRLAAQIIASSVCSTPPPIPLSPSTPGQISDRGQGCKPFLTIRLWEGN